MDQHCALFIAGTVFGLVAVLHILRLIYKFDIVIAGKHIPLWANGIGLIVAVGLSLWMFMVM